MINHHRLFSDLWRLCYLFNCLTKFQIINNGTINNQQQTQDYIKELKHSLSNNTFIVDEKCQNEKLLPINEKENV
ncbi:unnamed protein product [Didymodactylos carnosus]|uniref:Uncharacterized protein n=1 Tax=Didymodactylos carnosus TaxID=1234261 RepID=A0A816CGF1_9BILA|nr:unnamed protein product [Didymodactylos carnosus]CAF4516934.1 unnamed protein product [Didymodactylos carnosus]